MRWSPGLHKGQCLGTQAGPGTSVPGCLLASKHLPKPRVIDVDVGTDHKARTGRHNILLLMSNIMSFREELHTTHPCNVPSKSQTTQAGHLTEIKTHPTMR